MITLLSLPRMPGPTWLELQQSECPGLQLGLWVVELQAALCFRLQSFGAGDAFSTPVLGLQLGVVTKGTSAGCMRTALLIAVSEDRCMTRACSRQQVDQG